MTLIALALTLGCSTPGCPEGFLADNDGNCVLVETASEDDGGDGDGPDRHPRDGDDDTSTDDPATSDEETSTTAPSEPGCDPHDRRTCVGDDVYWVDSCGTTEELEDSCATACLDSGTDAGCVLLEFQCEDDGHTCYESTQLLALDFECEVRNLGMVALVLTEMNVLAPLDDNDVDSWTDDDWTGSLTLPPNSWVTVNTFDVFLNDDLYDEELEIEADLHVELGDDSVWVFDADDAGSTDVDVYDSWICWQ